MKVWSNRTWLTNHARRILSLSQDAAKELGHVWIEPEHILIGMARAENTSAFFVLSDADIIAAKLVPFLRSRISQSSKKPQFDIELGVTTKRMLDICYHIMKQHRLIYIDATVLLIGLMRLKHSGIEAVLEHFQLEATHIIEMAEAYLEEETGDSLPKQKPSLMNNIVQSFQELFRKKKNDE